MKEWLARFRRGESIEPVKNGKRQKRKECKITLALKVILVEMVMKDPVAFLDEMQKTTLNLMNLNCSLPTMCKTLQQLGLTRQKVCTRVSLCLAIARITLCVAYVRVVIMFVVAVCACVCVLPG